MTPQGDDPQREERAAMARIMGRVARLDGIDVTDAEFEEAIRGCPMHRGHRPCGAVALVRRKAREQGIDLPGLDPRTKRRRP